MDRRFSVLLTGPTFITDKQIEHLASVGIDVERNPDPTLSEDALVDALEGKDGYLLGGLERATTRVIESAPQLKAISFTGAGWTEFIKGHQAATERGIPITAAPGANAQAVAELTVGLIHDRVRQISYLSTEGRSDRYRGRNMRSLTLGIVGTGNVGVKVARILNDAYGTRILYVSPRRNLDLEFATGAQRTDLEGLLREADIVSLHMRLTNETVSLLGAAELSTMKDGAILINAGFAEAVDPRALFDELSKGRIQAAFDVPMHHLEGADLPDFGSLSQKVFLQMGSQSGFATVETVAIASEIASRAIENLLLRGDDSGVVNPDFRLHREGPG
jgi:phosphoglycerate dehydrogenase-like enzyme